MTATVTAQASRSGKKFAYVLRYTSGDSYVSEARYGSAQAAITAGTADAAAEAALVAAGLVQP